MSAFVRRTKPDNSDFYGGLPLEHFVIIRNGEGFPRIDLSDSRCGLEKEASPDGEISFD